MHRRPLLLIGALAALFVACSGAGANAIAPGDPPRADGGANANDDGAAGDDGNARADGNEPAADACKPITGFSAAARTYSIPAARCGASFDAFASTSSSLAYALFDVSGDGRSDLVVTRDACDDGVGDDRWDVYRADADGFAAKPVDFALPAARCGGRLDLASNVSSALAHATFDVDGDAFVDLMIVRDGCDDSIGKTRWDVYPGSASGFAKSPRAHVLPAPRCATKWNGTSAAGNVAYVMSDLSGDGVPDLVVTDDDCDGAVGDTHWDLYEGTGAGFAAKPTPFAIPAARCNQRFDATAGSRSISWSLLDLDGDRRLDLVVTADDCDDDLGVARWDVYPNTAAGFDASPRPHTLPAARCGSPFREPSRTGALAYTLTDFDCDRIPELVVTKDECAKAVGASHWDVYGGMSNGFAKAPKTVAVPPARCNRAFDALSAAGPVTYSIGTIATDGRALVVAHDACDDDIGASHWDVYRPR